MDWRRFGVLCRRSISDAAFRGLRVSAWMRTGRLASSGCLGFCDVVYEQPLHEESFDAYTDTRYQSRNDSDL